MTYYYVFMYLFICHYLLLKKVSVLWGGAAGKLLIADSRESRWILRQLRDDFVAIEDKS